MNDKIIELAFYTLPALVVGGVAYYLFDSYFKDQQNTRRWLMQRENQKHSLPLRLQAYERLSLLLERINPIKLVLRVVPISEEKIHYMNLLIQHIEQEFEHNMTQQIYVTNECWGMLLGAKNSIIQNIRKAAMNTEITTADQLREAILSSMLDGNSVSANALDFLKSEVKDIL